MNNKKWERISWGLLKTLIYTRSLQKYKSRQNKYSRKDPFPFFGMKNENGSHIRANEKEFSKGLYTILQRSLVISLLFFFMFAISTTVYAAKTSFDEYIIGPGDVLEIIVWKEPDFTRDATVRPDGRITLPLIDDVMAAGKTPMQLKEEIQKRLQEYIDLPVVTVIVKNINSKFYYIIGEIKSPGAYSLSKPMTILQALAVAGGFTEWADKDNIMVLRMENGTRKILHFSYDKAAKGKEINDFYLMPDDIILVP